MPIIQIFTSFKGRIGRLTFIAASIVLIVLYAVVLAILGQPLHVADVTIWHGIAFCVFTFPHWTLSVKRAHDLNKSGWWLAGWLGVLFIDMLFLGLATALMTSGQFALAMLLTLATVLVSLAVIYQTTIELIFFAGTAGNNDFGPPSRMIQNLFNDDSEMMEPAGVAHFVAAPSRTPQVAAAGRVPSPAVKTAPPAATAPAGFGRRNVLRTS